MGHIKAFSHRAEFSARGSSLLAVLVAVEYALRRHACVEEIRCGEEILHPQGLDWSRLEMRRYEGDQGVRDLVAETTAFLPEGEIKVASGFCGPSGQKSVEVEVRGTMSCQGRKLWQWLEERGIPRAESLGVTLEVEGKPQRGRAISGKRRKPIEDILSSQEMCERVKAGLEELFDEREEETRQAGCDLRLPGTVWCPMSDLIRALSRRLEVRQRHQSGTGGDSA